MRQASSPRLLPFLLFFFSRAQDVIPVLGRRRQAKPVAARFFGDVAQAAGEGLALAVGIRGGDELSAGTCGEHTNRGICRRRSSSARAEIETALAQAFERGQAHGINRRLGDTQTRGIERTETEEHL